MCIRTSSLPRRQIVTTSLCSRWNVRSTLCRISVRNSWWPWVIISYPIILIFLPQPRSVCRRRTRTSLESSVGLLVGVLSIPAPGCVPRLCKRLMCLWSITGKRWGSRDTRNYWVLTNWSIHLQSLRTVAPDEWHKCGHLSGDVVCWIQGRWKRFMSRWFRRSADAREERPVVFNWWVFPTTKNCAIVTNCDFPRRQASSPLATHVLVEASLVSTIGCRTPWTGSPMSAMSNTSPSHQLFRRTALSQ